jgi:hypothetical protein
MESARKDGIEGLDRVVPLVQLPKELDAGLQSGAYTAARS